MQYFMILLVLASLALVAAHVGDLTHYNPSARGSCGWQNHPNEIVVAVSSETMSNGANPNRNPKCGQEIKIFNPQTGRKAIAIIVDTCPDCKAGSLSATDAIWASLSPGTNDDTHIPNILWSGTNLLTLSQRRDNNNNNTNTTITYYKDDKDTITDSVVHGYMSPVPPKKLIKKERSCFRWNKLWCNNGVGIVVRPTTETPTPAPTSTSTPAPTSDATATATSDNATVTATATPLPSLVAPGPAPRRRSSKRQYVYVDKPWCPAYLQPCDYSVGCGCLLCCD